MRHSGGLDSRGTEANDAAWEAGRGALAGASRVCFLICGFGERQLIFPCSGASELWFWALLAML